MWGADTQIRLRSAKLLVINLGGIGTETVKNLVLGGINSIEIQDDSVVREEDFAAQFFLPNDDSIIGQKKLPNVLSNIKDLNPRVKLTINTEPLSSLSREYFKSFDLIVATELTKPQMIALNGITREYGIPLYVSGTHGMFGYILTDLIKHESTKESEIGNQPREANTKINEVKTITNVKVNEKENKEVVTIQDTFEPLSTLFTSQKLPTQLNRRQLKRMSGALPLIFLLLDFDRLTNPDEVVNITTLAQKGQEVCTQLGLASSIVLQEYLELFSQQAFTEFAPVVAIIGGFLAQDIIQFLGKKESPINNCLVLDAVQSELPIYYL